MLHHYTDDIARGWEREIKICVRSVEKYPKNYYAWTFRIRFIEDALTLLPPSFVSLSLLSFFHHDGMDQDSDGRAAE